MLQRTAEYLAVSHQLQPKSWLVVEEIPVWLTGSYKNYVELRALLTTLLTGKNPHPNVLPRPSPKHPVVIRNQEQEFIMQQVLLSQYAAKWVSRIRKLSLSLHPPQLILHSATTSASDHAKFDHSPIKKNGRGRIPFGVTCAISCFQVHSCGYTKLGLYKLCVVCSSLVSISTSRCVLLNKSRRFCPYKVDFSVMPSKKANRSSNWIIPGY